MDWRYFGKQIVREFRHVGKRLVNTNWTRATTNALRDGHRNLSKTRPYFWGRIGVASIILGRLGYVYGTRFERDITVTKSFHQLKEDLHGNTEYEYFVADKQHDLYRVIPSWWYIQWYPQELWASLHEGGTYRVVCYGFRSRKLKIYPNLVRMKKVVLEDNK